MKNKPLVSICIPTYNGEQYLQHTLDSITGQTYKNIEVIISDDKSADQTIQICKKFKRSVNFPVYIHPHTPQGIGANWNHCIRKSNGEFIKFLFQDDIMHPECVEKLMNLFSESETIGLVTCRRTFEVEDTGVSLNKEKWLNTYTNLQSQFQTEKANEILRFDKTIFRHKDLLSKPENKFGEPSTFLFKKDLVNKIGFFHNELKQSLDYEFCYRVLKEHEIWVHPDFLVKFRIHSQQATNINRKESYNDFSEIKKILLRDYFFLLSTKTQKELILFQLHQFRKKLFF